MRFIRLLPALLLVVLVHLESTVFAALSSETVSYMNGKHAFAAYVYKPEGKGPFPVVVWNHGKAKHLLHAGPSSEYDDLARLYVNDGYVLFLPDRHMHDVAPDYSDELKKLLENPKQTTATKDRKYTEYLEINANDIAVAVEWLKEQPYVDKDRIVLSGWSSGAAAALVAMEKGLNVRACIPISPGVTQWRTSPVLSKRLLRAVQTAKAPIFLIQPREDVTLEPMSLLGKALEKKGGLNQAKVYPFSGKADTQVTSMAVAGWDRWGHDALVFLDEVMKK